MSFEEKLNEYVKGLGPREGKFLVVHEGTVPLRIEVKTDWKLGKLLIGKYETVMRSRYFGKGGIEIVCSGQLSDEEVIDLVRLGWEMVGDTQKVMPSD